MEGEEKSRGLKLEEHEEKMKNGKKRERQERNIRGNIRRYLLFGERQFEILGGQRSSSWHTMKQIRRRKSIEKKEKEKK